jgi:hypothetical protein
MTVSGQLIGEKVEAEHLPKSNVLRLSREHEENATPKQEPMAKKEAAKSTVLIQFSSLQWGR